jgi:addiction module HigA family antidote
VSSAPTASLSTSASHPGRITDILDGRRAITADTAVRLGRYFGNRAQFRLDLQGQYCSHPARARQGDRPAGRPTLREE